MRFRKYSVTTLAVATLAGAAVAPATATPLDRHAAAQPARKSYNKVRHCAKAARGRLFGRNTDNDLRIIADSLVYDWGRLQHYPDGQLNYYRYDRYRVMVVAEWGYGNPDPTPKHGEEPGVIKLIAPVYCTTASGEYTDQALSPKGLKGWY